MKDGDITDQRPDRRNNDIAEMREQRRGRGKVRRSKGQSVRRQEEKDVIAIFTVLFLSLKKRFVDTNLYGYFYNKS